MKEVIPWIIEILKEIIQELKNKYTNFSMKKVEELLGSEWKEEKLWHIKQTRKKIK